MSWEEEEEAGRSGDQYCPHLTLTQTTQEAGGRAEDGEDGGVPPTEGLSLVVRAESGVERIILTGRERSGQQGG